MEKNFASLRVLFAANPESVNLTDLRRMKLFAENGLKGLNGAENSDDSVIESWLEYLKETLDDVNNELERRIRLIGSPKTAFEELKSLFANNPSILSDDELHLLKYMLENQTLVLGNPHYDDIHQIYVNRFNQMAYELLEEIEAEFEKRGK